LDVLEKSLNNLKSKAFTKENSKALNNLCKSVKKKEKMNKNIVNQDQIQEKLIKSGIDFSIADNKSIDQQNFKYQKTELKSTSIITDKISSQNILNTFMNAAVAAMCNTTTTNNNNNNNNNNKSNNNDPLNLSTGLVYLSQSLNQPELTYKNNNNNMFGQNLSSYQQPQQQIDLTNNQTKILQNSSLLDPLIQYSNYFKFMENYQKYASNFLLNNQNTKQNSIMNSSTTVTTSTSSTLARTNSTQSDTQSTSTFNNGNNTSNRIVTATTSC
jgi:hypothetical protein